MKDKLYLTSEAIAIHTIQAGLRAHWLMASRWPVCNYSVLVCASKNNTIKVAITEYGTEQPVNVIHKNIV